MMLKNVGRFDRSIRIAAGIVLLSLVFVGPKTLVGLIGLVPLITGLAGSCYAYTLFGWNTGKKTD